LPPLVQQRCSPRKCRFAWTKSNLIDASRAACNGWTTKAQARGISEWTVGPRRQPRKRVCNTKALEAFERLRGPRMCVGAPVIDKALPAGVPRVARNSALSATVRFAMTLRDDSSRFRLPWVCSLSKTSPGMLRRKASIQSCTVSSRERVEVHAQGFYLSQRLQW
jgi:hypothetical protein